MRNGCSRFFILFFISAVVLSMLGVPIIVMIPLSNAISVFLLIGIDVYRYKKLIRTVVKDLENPLFTNPNEAQRPINKEMRRDITGGPEQQTELTEFITIEIPAVEKQKGKHKEGYRGELIIPKQSSANPKEPYATFDKMRKTVRKANYIDYNNIYSYIDSKAEVFLKQAEYMKGFVDDYRLEKPLNKHYTTYEDMDDEQLRTYFTWRAKVRNGEIKDISLSYAFCYIFELINDIGIYDANDGLKKLTGFWNGFRIHSDKIDSYLSAWVKDYYITHYAKLSDSLDTVLEAYPIPYKTQITSIDNLKQGLLDINLLEMHSTYKITKKAFYKNGNTKDIEDCLNVVVEALCELFNRNGLDFLDIFLSKHTEGYMPFKGAVYTSQTDEEDLVVKLSEYETCIRKQGQWSIQTYNTNEFSHTKGYILKTIEIHMRSALGGKQNLKAPTTSELIQEFKKLNHSWEKVEKWRREAYQLIKSKKFEQTIICAIQKYKSSSMVASESTISENKSLEIDMSELTRVRKEHMQTAEKLNTEDEENVEDVEVAEIISAENTPLAKSLEGFSALVSLMSTDEYIFVTSLLNSENIIHTDLELMVEAINEKALDSISDNLIEGFDGQYFIYEEYSGELLKSLEGIS